MKVQWKEDCFAAEIHVHEPPPSYQRRSIKTHSGLGGMKIWTTIPSLYVLLLWFLYPSCHRWHSMLGILLLLYLNPHTVVHLNRQPISCKTCSTNNWVSCPYNTNNEMVSLCYILWKHPIIVCDNSCMIETITYLVLTVLPLSSLSIMEYNCKLIYC
jgi:hypothetical protein